MGNYSDSNITAFWAEGKGNIAHLIGDVSKVE